METNLLTNRHQYSLSGGTAYHQHHYHLLQGLGQATCKSFSQIYCCYRSKSDTRLITVSLFCLGKDLEGKCHVIRAISLLVPGGTEKTTEKLCKRYRCLNRDSILASPKYKSTFTLKMEATVPSKVGNYLQKYSVSYSKHLDLHIHLRDNLKT
jgi:hypothetical protein